MSLRLINGHGRGMHDKAGTGVGESNRPDTKFPEVNTKFHGEGKWGASRGVRSNIARSANNLFFLRETSCSLRGTSCPIDLH